VLNIGVLASGRGSNFQSIIDSIESGYIKGSIKLLVVDKADAYAIKRARKHGIDHVYMDPSEFDGMDAYYSAIVQKLNEKGVDLVVLAGFMRIVGRPLLEAFHMRVMNIHPALLPSFPGLEGQKQALDYGVRITGCTVHFVDEGVDTGPIIMQAAVPILPEDTEESLSERILKYEHRIFPKSIKLFAEGKIRVDGRRVQVDENAGPDSHLVNPPL